MSSANEDDWGTENTEMTFDTDGVDESKVGNRASVDKPGKYHFEISNAKERPEKINEKGKPRTPDILLSCVVLRSVPGQSPENAMYFHNVILGGKGGGAPEQWAIEGTVNFLFGVGILKKVDGKFIDPETGSTKINLSTLAARLKGLQFIGDIKREKSRDEQFDDRYCLSFGRGAYQVDDPFVMDVPKNKDALAMIGKASAAAPAAPAAAPKSNGSAKSKAAETVPAGAGADLTDDPAL